MILKVELPVFDGPLDLLLHLIEKNKINIFDIPIVDITEQYLAYVRQMETEDLGIMSEFMVMASELISIKCRMLLPAETDEEWDELDPRDDLVRRLLEYKMYKYISGELREYMDGASKSFYKSDTTPREVLDFRPEIDPSELIGDLTLKKLHNIFDQVLRRQTDKIDPVRSRFGTIKREEVRLKDKLLELTEYASKKGRFSFREILLNQKSRTQVIVTFLAMLELMKYGIIEAGQDGIDDEIWIESVPEADISKIDMETEFETE